MKTVPLIQPAPRAPTSEAALASVERFRRLISNGSWFAAVGAQLTAAELGEVASYLAAIGLGRWSIRAVQDWAQAGALSARDVWDSEWREAEQDLRLRLFEAARAGLDEAQLNASLATVAEAAQDAVHGAAALVAARSGSADAALLREAASAAASASADAALALATGGNADHPFATKHRLFAAGRWPLGVVDGQFHLF